MDLRWIDNKSKYVDPNEAINNFYPSETNRLNDLGTVRGRLALAVDQRPRPDKQGPPWLSCGHQRQHRVAARAGAESPQNESAAVFESDKRHTPRLPGPPWRTGNSQMPVPGRALDPCFVPGVL